MSTPLERVVSTSEAVAATSSRTEKVAEIAALLRELAPSEVAAVVGFLAGEPRQGRIGVGWATVANVAEGTALQPSLQVADLDRTIDELESVSGPGSSGAREDLLERLLAAATPAEGRFVGRLLTGELRQGALEGVMAQAIAQAAGVPQSTVRRAFMLNGDLGTTAELALSGGEDALAGVGLEPLRAIRPMLASTADDLAAALAALGCAAVEWKLDGVRVQVHRREADVRLFTRNLNDVSERLPELVAAAQALPVSAVVLDAEALTLAPGERPHAFQETMSRFGSAAADEATIVPFVFDCLHLDGDDLIDRPLEERRAILQRIAPSLAVPSTITDSLEEAQAVLDEAIEVGHEGVMVKDVASPYTAGRRGKAWLKVKPVLTVDLVVLAVDWGHGRRSGYLSNLHLGARDPAGGFVMVGKTFKGMTDELLAWQTDRFLELEAGRRGITVEVRPEQVVEIALDSVQRSTRYPGGVALRFARVKGYRDDKAAGEADTIDALRALLPGSAGR